MQFSHQSDNNKDDFYLITPCNELYEKFSSDYLTKLAFISSILLYPKWVTI